MSILEKTYVTILQTYEIPDGAVYDTQKRGEGEEFFR